MKNLKKQYVFSLLALVFSVTALKAQMSSKQIDSLVFKAMKTLDNTVGFSIGIVKNGEILHAKGYGLTSIKTNKKVTLNTPFGIASNSKAYTSAALAILVDQGKLKWEDKVIDYIPEFKMYNDYVTNNFNIQDLGENNVTYKITDVNGNSAETNIKVTITQNSLSVKDITADYFIRIYPNPVINKIFFKFENTLKLDKVEVFSISGKKLIVRENVINFVDINILSKGFYLVKITTDKNSFVKQFLKI